MKMLVILLLGLQVFWATASPTTVSTFEISADKSRECSAYCGSVARHLQANTITIESKDTQIKELEAKVTELEAKLARKGTSEAAPVESTDDLVSSLHLKIDAIRNKIKDIGNIYSGSVNVKKPVNEENVEK
ncbi:uncharacterized protein LOC133843703 isoform X1 [Drosophila sulfurigaster albostrigata]|uniref:uncharacterized protein LOC133843703 isoform X1 n=1 Tax=Drosophila sulfurigaster albostrigata TaxID=89887 RepID=UPI002D21BF8A|nr:uncharacterized protein LOC133843703 isoform X1 [Drosophila sulfurigaster albostrigata]